jgi:hypothetical protein
MNWEQLAQVLTPTVTGVTVSGIWAIFAQRGRQAFEQRQAADQRIAQQREVAALSLELLQALFAPGQRSVVFLPGALLFTGSFLGVEPVFHGCQILWRSAVSRKPWRLAAGPRPL